MKRKDFLQLTGICGLGLITFSQLSFTSLQASYTREQLIGKGNPKITGNTYTSKMHVKAKRAFLDMKAAAAKDNINIEIVSAYRSFERQKEIFERKYLRFTKQGLSPKDAISKIIEYSTIPGTSRHHWGTDIDIIQTNTGPRPASVLQEKHFYGNGQFCDMYIDDPYFVKGKKTKKGNFHFERTWSSLRIRSVRRARVLSLRTAMANAVGSPTKITFLFARVSPV